jgi:hypothetical protein
MTLLDNVHSFITDTHGAEVGLQVDDEWPFCGVIFDHAAQVRGVRGTTQPKRYQWDIAQRSAGEGEVR